MLRPSSHFPLGIPFRLAALVAAAWLLAGAVPPARAQTPPTLIVSPNQEGETTANGNASYYPPWDLTSSTGTQTMHYQQVYASADFGGVSGNITQLGFRVSSANGSAFNPGTLVNVKIVLSSTTAAVGSLNTNFIGNLGFNATTVYNGPLVLSSSKTAPTVPNNNQAPAFDTRVYLTTPFHYNSTQNENLLLDVEINNTNGYATTYFDGESGSTTSSEWAPGTTAATATTTVAGGLVTQFMFGTTAMPHLGGAPGGIAWMMTDYDYTNLSNANPTVSAASFGNASTYIFTDNSTTGTTTTSVPSGYYTGGSTGAGSGTYTYPGGTMGGIDFKAFNDLQTAVTNGWLRPASGGATGLQAILYDNEDWTATPETLPAPGVPSDEEQTMPQLYEVLFANLAHAYGYTYFATPALDIMTAQPTEKGPSWEAYLTMGFPTSTFPQFTAAAPADVYEIQAQSLIASNTYSINIADYAASAYDTLLSGGSGYTGAVTQAGGTNARAVIFAGIATDAASSFSSADQLTAAVLDSQGAGVAGYWINGGSNISVAITLLQRLLSAGYTQNAAVGPGQTVSFSTTATGSPPYTYQWDLNGAPISGATNAALVVSNVTAANAGAYTCVFNNSAGATIAAGGVLTVLSPPALLSAASTLTQGSAGAFGWPVAWTATASAPATPYPVECRATTGLSLVLIFNKAIGSAQASLGSGTATVGTPVCSGTQVTVPLSGVANAQNLVVDLTNVTGTDGSVLPAATVGLAVLLGDVNGGGSVNISDINLIRAASGIAPGDANFLYDINADGSINISDINLVRAASGTGVP